MTDAARDFPVPAFAVGDTAFKADVIMSHRQLPCPDCGGEKTVPAQLQHETVQIDCPRCQHISRRKDLEVHEYTPSVRCLTIGSIQIDTNKDDPVAYMAVETGVGSGSIHYESTLFHDEESAQAHAQKIAQEKNADPNHPQYQRNERAREVSVYSLTNSIRREYTDRIIPVESERDALFDCLVEIIEYSGGADSALDDEYVMNRAGSLIAKMRGEDE